MTNRLSDDPKPATPERREPNTLTDVLSYPPTTSPLDDNGQLWASIMPARPERRSSLRRWLEGARHTLAGATPRRLLANARRLPESLGLDDVTPSAWSAGLAVAGVGAACFIAWNVGRAVPIAAEPRRAPVENRAPAAQPAPKAHAADAVTNVSALRTAPVPVAVATPDPEPPQELEPEPSARQDDAAPSADAPAVAAREVAPKKKKARRATAKSEKRARAARPNAKSKAATKKRAAKRSARPSKAKARATSH